MNNINKKLQIITTELNGKIAKDASVNYGSTKFKYMSLDNIYKSLLPLLNENNCIVYFTTNGGFLTCNFEDTEDITSRAIITSIPLITENETQKDKLKALGSALTYSKRYLLANLFNLVASEDHEEVTAINNVNPLNVDILTTNEPQPTYNIPCRVCKAYNLNMNAKFESKKDGRILAPCKNCVNPLDPKKKVWTPLN